MSKSYNAAIKEVMPSVTRIIDRFHIVKNLNKNLVDLQKKSYKTLPEDERERYSRIWRLLCKSPKDLTKKTSKLVKEYLEYNTSMKPIYLLVLKFRTILFESKRKTKEIVEMELRNWIDEASIHLSDFCKTLINWLDGIVNACIYSYSNARQEGLNNLIKLVKRRGRGYNNTTAFKLRIQAESS
jgi:transposase